MLGIHHVASTGFSSLEELIDASTTRLQVSIESFVLNQSPPREQLSRPRDTTIKGIFPTPQAQAGSQNDDSGANGVESSQVFGVVASVRQRCRQGCICQCHLRKLARTSSGGFLSKTLGQLFLNYSSIPVWVPRPYNYVNCQNQRRKDDSAPLRLPELAVTSSNCLHWLVGKPDWPGSITPPPSPKDDSRQPPNLEGHPA